MPERKFRKLDLDQSRGWAEATNSIIKGSFESLNKVRNWSLNWSTSTIDHNGLTNPCHSFVWFGKFGVQCLVFHCTYIIVTQFILEIIRSWSVHNYQITILFLWHLRSHSSSLPPIFESHIFFDFDSKFQALKIHQSIARWTFSSSNFSFHN